MPMQRAFVVVSVVVCLSLASFNTAFPKEQRQVSAPATAHFDAGVTQVLGAMCAKLSGMRAFSFDAQILTDTVYRDGSKVQFARNMTVRVKRPDQFIMTTTGDDLTATSVYDGRTFTLLSPKANAYATVDAPGDIDSTLEFLYKVHHVESPLGDLLLKNPCSAFKGVAGFSLGKGLVGKTLCDHLYVKSKDFDWQIWVEAGDNPLPRKIVITEKRLPLAPQFVAFLDNWKAEDAGPIAFTAPAGAKRETSFAPLLHPKK